MSDNKTYTHIAPDGYGGLYITLTRERDAAGVVFRVYRAAVLDGVLIITPHPECEQKYGEQTEYYSSIEVLVRAYYATQSVFPAKTRFGEMYPDDP